MAVLQGGGQNLPPPHVCVIQKTPCGIGLNELCTVEAEPVKIAVVKNLSRFKMK